jgi:hypothetical protein
MVGGIVACYILSALLPGSTDFNLSIGANTSVTQALFIEMFAMVTLVLNVLMLGAGMSPPPAACTLTRWDGAEHFLNGGV